MHPCGVRGTSQTRYQVPSTEYLALPSACDLRLCWMSAHGTLSGRNPGMACAMNFRCACTRYEIRGPARRAPCSRFSQPAEQPQWVHGQPKRSTRYGFCMELEVLMAWSGISGAGQATKWFLLPCQVRRIVKEPRTVRNGRTRKARRARGGIRPHGDFAMWEVITAHVPRAYMSPGSLLPYRSTLLTYASPRRRSAIVAKTCP